MSYCNARTRIGDAANWLLAIALAGAASHAGAAGYGIRQWLTPVASGEGAPSQVFGLSVAIDGDLAVVSEVGSGAEAGVIRTYERSGSTWSHLAGQDITISGDSGALVAFNEGTLVRSIYNSNTGSGTLIVSVHQSDGWHPVYNLSSNNTYFDSLAATEGIIVAGDSSYDGGTGADQGRVRILRRISGDTWGTTVLLPSVPQAGAHFGTSVAIVAGAVVVGAPRENVAAYNHAGAAYVFELTQDTWSEVAHLVEPVGGDHTDNHFGTAVAISGTDTAVPDRMLISSLSNATTGRSGHVRSYTRTNGTWTARTVLQALSPVADDGYGCGLALDDVWAVIGLCNSSAGAPNGGAVQLVKFSSGFTSVLSQTLRSDPLAAENDYLGSRVAVDRVGPTIMVGNPIATINGNDRQGVVLFGGPESGNPFALTRKLWLDQGLTDATYGWFAVDGDTLFVGAPGEDVGAQQNRGAVYEYRRIANGAYQFQSRILAPDGMAGDAFGQQITLKGDIALVSALGRKLAGVEEAGAVYAFHRSADVWSLEAQLLPVAPGYETLFGIGTAFDGSSALVGDRTGKTIVYERSSIGSWTPMQTIDHRGFPVLLSGDTAMLADAFANNDIGEVAIYARSGDSWVPDGVISGSNALQSFGTSASLAGDLLAVGSNGVQRPVQLFRRTQNGWLPEASLLPNDVTSNTYCSRVAMSVHELAMGCRDVDGIGAIYIFEKVAGAWTQQQKVLSFDPQENAAFGYTLGFGPGGTLFGGAPWYDYHFLAQGALYVFAGDRLFDNGFE
ncbi:MAG: FG-GAP repeat protein [Dokdonella sp.]